MRILVTNDDGIEAPGLKLLVKAAKLLGRVKVVVPPRDRSGEGSSCHLSGFLKLGEDGDLGWKPENDKTATLWSAHPVDCVRYGMAMFKPQLVLVGINNGLNVGANALCSGTVCAAAMAARLGAKKAIAFSMHKPNWKAWSPEVLVRLIQDVMGLIVYPAHNVSLPPKPPKGESYCIRYLDQDTVMDAMPLIVTKNGELVLKLEPELDRKFKKIIYACPIKFQA